MALALGVVLLGGCGSADEEGTVPPSPSTGPPLLQPSEGEVRDARRVATDDFSLTAPGRFTESTRTGPQGVDMLVLSTPADAPGAAVEVVAYASPDRGADVQAQMDVLVTELRELRDAQDVVSSAVTWPGAETAVVVRWTQATSTADGPVTEEFHQLTVAAEDGRSATAIAVAPDVEVDASGVVEVLRTFRLADA